MTPSDEYSAAWAEDAPPATPENSAAEGIPAEADASQASRPEPAAPAAAAPGEVPLDPAALPVTEQSYEDAWNADSAPAAGSPLTEAVMASEAAAA